MKTAKTETKRFILTVIGLSALGVVITNSLGLVLGVALG